MINLKKYSAIVVFFLIPILTISFLMKLNDFSLKISIKETAFNCAILFFIVLLISVFKNKSLKKIIAMILLVPYYCILFIKIFTLFHFFNFIDNAVLYTVFETNLNEASGFLDGYFKWYYPLVFLLYLLILSIIIFKQAKQLKICNLIYLDILILICTAISYRFYERSLTFLTINTFIEYKLFSTDVSNDISTKQSKYLTKVSNNENEALYVVIIGESTTRNNMRIYNYYRNTNPQLQKIKNELYVYNNVISPHTHTILSLDKVLSMGDYHNPQNNKLGTVIQLANQAGFETSWLSNQKPIGIYESLMAVYAKAAKNQLFMSNFSDGDTKYDEVLLPKLQQLINKKSLKKMIFIHLRGCHINYHENYPDTFNVFKNAPKTKFYNEESHQLINNYDNAIRYNDFIIYEIINTVKKANKNSYVLYFSDHGEEVFNEYDYFGHIETIGSNAMFEIPFILWTSDKYKEKSKIDFSKQLERKYNLEDFIYSFSELSRIEFDQFQPTKSIFNESFKYKKRLILNNIDYDQRVKDK